MNTQHKSLVPRLSVLLIEDNDDHIEIFKHLFRNLPSLNGTLSVYKTLGEGIAAVRKDPFQLVFLDLGLPDSSGLETLSSFLDSVGPCPVIVLTATNDMAIGIDAVKMGAQDYLVKGEYSASLLERVMRYAIERQSHLILLEAQNAEIRLALKEKELLLKEVHHRVKNNLQVISSLLRLQAETSKNPEIAKVLRTSEHRIRSMAIVHERMYRSSSFSSIDFGAYIEELTRQLMSIGDRKHSLKLNLSKVSLPVDKAIPCGLILNELVTNSLKHAFTDSAGGLVTVSLAENDGWVTLGVEDNGKGMPPDINPRAVKTLGFEIITSLTTQLRGELHFESEKGTRISLKFFVPQDNPVPAPSKPGNQAQ